MFDLNVISKQHKMSYKENIPIIYAPDSSGVFKHIDDVSNGNHCGCFCPNPDCRQPLIAKNAGSERIHHFAHKGGACTWAAENAVTGIALTLIKEIGRFSFPTLSYLDAESGIIKTLSEQKTLAVVSSSLQKVSGRGAPELILTCGSREKTKKFAVVFSLVHKVSQDNKDHLSGEGMDTVLVDLISSIKSMKEEMGKHFDRNEVIAKHQERDFIKNVLIGESFPFKAWVVNGKRDAAERESKRRKKESDALKAREAERITKGFRAMPKTRNDMPKQSSDMEQANLLLKMKEAFEKERAICEKAGNRAIRRVKRGQLELAEGCPLHGDANIVGQCGAYGWSSSQCPYYIQRRPYSIECAFKEC